jgi:hypothetical protein
LRCAISDRCGERPLYVIAEPYRHLHPFPDEVASFSRAHVETACARYVWRPSPDFIATVPVPTIDWPTLVARHGPFDFVAIDAEGYDGEILQLMDLTPRSPRVILYEHRHLDQEMKERCVKRLERAGYVVRQVNKTDTLASRIGPPLDF